MGSEQSSNKQNTNTNARNIPNSRTYNAGTNQRQRASAEPDVLYERDRAPYSYAQNDLQNYARIRTENLYPNLPTNNNQYSNYGVNATRNTTENRSGFVYVKTESIPTYPRAERTVPLRPTPPRTFTPSTSSAPRVNTPTRSNTPSRPVTPSAPASAPSLPRERSRTRRNDNDVYQCPTCNNKYGIGIYSCPNGHSSCKNCRMQNVPCGICGLHITDTRNYAMEDFMAQIKVPCPNASDGCTLYLKTIDMESHVSECPFGDMPCPMNTVNGNCRWRGKLSQIVAHFDDLHTAERNADVDTEMILPNICSDNYNLYLVPLTPYCFIFHVKVDATRRCVYMAAQLLGTGMSAAKWDYEVHIYNKREPRRKFMYVAKCTTATIPIDKLVNEAECATIPLPYALSYINEGILTYKFFIKKVNNTSRSNFKHNDNNNSAFRGNRRGRRGFHHKAGN